MTADRSIPADCIRIHLLKQLREPFDKILAVRVIFKYRFAFDPSNDDMLQVAGGIYASSARHVIEIRYLPKLVNIETYYVPVYKLSTLKQRPCVYSKIVVCSSNRKFKRILGRAN